MKKHEKFKITNSREDFLKYIKSFLPKNPVCAEIGVLRGEYALKIYQNLEPSELQLVDPWNPGLDKNAPVKFYPGLRNGTSRTVGSTSNDLEIVKNNFRKQITSGSVKIFQQYSYDHVKDCNDEYFDFVYIDATHIYEAALADLRAYLPKVKKGGILCGDDYLVCNHFSVKKAVDQFADENNLEFLSIGNGLHEPFKVSSKEFSFIKG
jgi:hypothetical protein